MAESLKKIFKIIGAIILFFILLLIFIAFINTNSKKVITESAGNENYAVMGSTGSMSFGVSRDQMAVKSAAESDLSIVAPSAGAQAFPAQAVAQADKKIIKTGNLNLKVEEADKSAEEITAIAKANKGEVFNLNFYESARGTKSGSITIRVPFDKFETTFSEIKKVATQVLSESTNAQDITEEYVDLEARLKNKRAEELSFQELLNRWGKVDEVLSVTRELARVRGEIEQLEGRQRYLNSQTDMSTITVNISEDVEITPVSQDWRPLQVFKSSARELIANSQNFIDGIIRFVIAILPLMAIYVFIIWLIYYIGKKIFKRFKTPKQP